VISGSGIGLGVEIALAVVLAIYLDRQIKKHQGETFGVHERQSIYDLISSYPDILWGVIVLVALLSDILRRT
jgi:hypothetical protein